MDYTQWNLTESKIYQNDSTMVKRRQKDGQCVVEKKIKLNSLNKEYAKLQINLMRQIKSPYVVEYLDHKQIDDQILLFMPFYANNDLEHYLLKKQQDLDFTIKIKMFIDILCGLADLHQKFIIHRDLKLKNIFVDQKGNCLIGDLGIAVRAAGDVYSQLGTIGYQAPEVYSLSAYDQKIDLWGIGIIAYQLFNRKRKNKIPFPFGSPEQLSQRIIKRGQQVKFNEYKNQTKTIDQMDQDLPKQIKQMIKLMLVNNPVQRISWVQFYQFQFLKPFDKQLRLINFSKLYSDNMKIKQIMRDYQENIQQSKNKYFYKLKYLVDRKNFQLFCNKYNLIKQDKRKIFIFHFLICNSILTKFQYIEGKKIYRYLLKEKRFIKQVKSEKYETQKKINFWLRQIGEKQIADNDKYHTPQYFMELSNVVEHILNSMPQLKQIQNEVAN